MSWEDYMSNDLERPLTSMIFYVVILAIYSFIAMFMLIKIKFRLECIAWFNMIIFFTALLTMTIGAIVDYCITNPELYNFIDIFNSNSDFLVQLTLFVFIFEMRQVYVKIES